MSVAQDMGRVAVLYGGWSAEREVSLESGRNAHAGLVACGVDAELVDARPATILELPEAGFERVFIALHGRGGEDGKTQAALDLLGLPYTGTGVLGSALAMSKWHSKLIFQGAGLPTPPYRVLTAATDLESVAAEIGFPMFIKPSSEGSSIGMTRVDRLDQLAQAYRQAAQFDSCVLAERFVAGREFTATILGDSALPLIEIEAAREFYDYTAKYDEAGTQYHCPTNLSAFDERELTRLCREAFERVGAQGWGRVDFLLDSDGQPWLLEVNTVPGLTSHSLVPMAAAQAGIDGPGLMWQILQTSLPSRSAP